MANVLNGVCFNIFTVHIHIVVYSWELTVLVILVQLAGVFDQYLCSQTRFRKDILFWFAVLDPSYISSECHPR